MSALRWFGWQGLRCSGGRLLYLSRRWQVQVTDRPRWRIWRVRGFGGGVALHRLDIVMLPKLDWGGHD